MYASKITRNLQATLEAINNPNNLTQQERANLRRLLNSLLAEEYGDDQEKALINAIKRDVNLLLD